MINSYDDLKAQRAQAHNDLQVAKSRLIADSRNWQEEVKPLRLVSSVARQMFTNKLVGSGKKGLLGNGLQLGLNTLIGRTALRRLPMPLNILLPHVLENVAINYTQKNGRDWLIAGLKWVKKVTDEKEPEVKLIEKEAASMGEFDSRQEEIIPVVPANPGTVS
ncbi:hypothetical protein [Arundinibacter roseus]|uniref:Uncharacterized protein n=1 Tax=Arundinibacter roseus TaxID=2070510 RepID=A0A4R4KBK9_9BACT|nr:hypothetical protein [Arundinibacter roseus]TDB65190.1 hypothetical protein EZE20_10800 [Arundinibacter roseus]